MVLPFKIHVALQHQELPNATTVVVEMVLQFNKSHEALQALAVAVAVTVAQAHPERYHNTKECRLEDVSRESYSTSIRIIEIYIKTLL